MFFANEQLGAFKCYQGAMDAFIVKVLLSLFASFTRFGLVNMPRTQVISNAVWCKFIIFMSDYDLPTRSYHQ